MPDLSFLVAGRLDTRTGGSIYNRRIAAGLRGLGWTVDVHELDDTFPFPTAGALAHADSLLSQLPDRRLVLVDGLAFGAMPDVVARASQRCRLAALVHLPLAAEIGRTPEEAGRLQESERMALSYAHRVVVTGPATRRLMETCGLRHDQVAVVEPGTAPAPLAVGSCSGDVHLLTVAAVTPGKGHEALIDALAALPHRRWRLACAGSVTRSPGTVATVREAITRNGLETNVSMTGELGDSELAACYHRADVLVSASLRETFGMSIAEAIARGLPVVATATGAAHVLVGDAAGIIVPVADAGALTDALSRMIDDREFRTRCAAGARRVRAELHDWNEAAARLARALLE
jgi:glycosyltransferase involved in cell wall biosynthesis